MSKCKATTQSGKRCSRKAKENGYCFQHQPDYESNAGRKSKYNDINLEEVKEWAKEGLTDYEISKRLGIGTTTLYEWKNKHPKFKEALKKSKKQADFKVEDSLFKRANGYKYDEVTQELVEDPRTGELELKPVKVVTKEVKPDPTSMIFWLKNRKPAEWKDKKNIDVTSKGKEISAMTEEEREKRRQELRAKLGEE